jgi:competence protein ComEA
MKSSRMWLGCLVAIAVALGGAGAPGAADKPAEKGKERATAVLAGERVNINTATEAELGKLSGVGGKLAKRIVEYRDAHGEFKRPEDIRKVEGVGKNLWEQNRDRIVVK